MQVNISSCLGHSVNISCKFSSNLHVVYNHKSANGHVCNEMFTLTAHVQYARRLSDIVIFLTSNMLYSFFRSLMQFFHTIVAGDGSCGLNVHNVGAHLVDYVEGWGPLWAWSTFGFEDMNGTLMDFCHGTGNVCRQVSSSKNLVRKCHWYCGWPGVIQY